MFSVNVFWKLMSSYEKKKKHIILVCKIQKKVYLLMFTGKVIVKFLLCCIIDNGLR